MYKLKKDGVVRIVTTEDEAKRWESLGYDILESPEAASEDSSDENGEKTPPAGKGKG